jgi:hypothetical protein
VAAEIGVFGLAAFLFLIFKGFTASIWTRKQLAWIYRRRSKKQPQAVPEDGLDAHDRMFLQTHAAAMIACMVGWVVCAIFASVAFHWTLYYLVGLSVTARDVVKNRARAYARAKALAEQEVAAA